ncbi:hypothetical protein GPECTOR_9g416 [Gonium pectorale]|uniref:Uncharacterized protein n=1 Tax=Gonium pectorale TaxID=33097 RepID=A0A150GRJ0_GONPE|nr:hypothetical protein GPECTOR_9g416 [Gonium pectorale]|eukprot:KXZ52372.1 hypothetical protein GPECTOR_9g416 [Gonium pectorale]
MTRPQPPSARATADTDVRDTLQAVLDVFDGPCSTLTQPASRQQLRDLAERQKQAAAKAVVLVMADSSEGALRAAVPEAELRGVTGALVQSTIALCSYAHGFTAGAGPSLRASLRELCAAVVSPTQELAAKLLDELVESSRQELAEPVGSPGQTGEGQGEAAVAPGAGGECEGREEGDVSSSGRGQPCRNGGEEEDKDEDDEEEGDSDDFREMGTLSTAELRTAEAAAELLTAAQAALRAVSRPLLEGPAVGPEHCLDDWESLAWHGAKLRSGCEALVACLYPPHEDEDELQGGCESVATTLELMLDEFPETYATEVVRQQLAAARGKVEAAAGKLTDALARAAGPTAA